MLSQRIEAARLSEFAAQGRQETLRLDVSDLPRLRAMLASETPFDLELNVSFSADYEGRPRLRLKLVGEFMLACQRCLGTLPWAVDLAATLTVVDDEDAAAELTEPFDSIVLEESALSLPAAIEDELLAAIPIAPMHETDRECDRGVAASRPDEFEEPANRPFAALEGLLGDRRAGGEEQD